MQDSTLITTVGKSVQEVLDLLASRLNAPAGKLWEIMQKQAKLEALQDFTWAFICLVASGVALVWFRQATKVLASNDLGYNDRQAEETFRTFSAGVMGVFSVFFVFCTVAGIKVLLNPDYYALQLIMKELK